MRSVLALALLTASCTIVQSAPGTPGYVSSGSATLELNVDRPGSDYRSFDLGSTRPEECRDTCMIEPQCVAFTYVNPGVQGPSARCWLKSAVPPPSANNCCVSGVKNAPPGMASGDYQGQPPAAPAAAPPPPRGSAASAPVRRLAARAGSLRGPPARRAPWHGGQRQSSRGRHRDSICPRRVRTCARRPACATAAAWPSLT